MTTRRATPGGSVSGAPAAWLRIEGLAGFLAGIAIYLANGGQVLALIPLLLAVDFSMIGYLIGPRPGSVSHNLAHNWAVGLVVLGAGWAFAAVLARSSLARSSSRTSGSTGWLATGSDTRARSGTPTSVTSGAERSSLRGPTPHRRSAPGDHGVSPLARLLLTEGTKAPEGGARPAAHETPDLREGRGVIAGDEEGARRQGCPGEIVVVRVVGERRVVEVAIRDDDGGHRRESGHEHGGLIVADSADEPRLDEDAEQLLEEDLGHDEVEGAIEGEFHETATVRRRFASRGETGSQHHRIEDEARPTAVDGHEPP